MKKLILLFLLLPVFTSAQNVNIPDANFKAYLVGDSSINTNGDGEIQVSEAILVDSINVSNKWISDLTGIEVFTALTYFECSYNNVGSFDASNHLNLTDLNVEFCSLPSLDVSSNTALESLECNHNHLTSIDVSSNLALISFDCSQNFITNLNVYNNIALQNLVVSDNYLTSLDVSNNTALVSLYCDENLLTSIDVSSNTALKRFSCWGNPLSSVDIRNGNNNNMTRFYAIYNSNLFCISVDDASWSNANWIGYPFEKDSWAIFSNDCTVGIEANQTSQPSITSTNNTITIKGKGTASIYNLTGQRVHHSKLFGNTSISLDKGIYLVRVTDEGNSFTKKVYIQ